MNPFFQAMGGNRQPNMMQQFLQFMNQMKGKDPNAMIQEMVSSGRISQDQLNQVQKQAQQMSGMFEGMRGMFGKCGQMIPSLVSWRWGPSPSSGS